MNVSLSQVNDDDDSDCLDLQSSDPVLYEKILTAVMDLKIKGYAVIADIISQERVEEYRSMMWAITA